jgi:hypothetical protein
MKELPTTVEFSDFCQRFVRNYWYEIAQNSHPLRSHSRRRKSFEKHLSGIEFSTSIEQDHDRKDHTLFVLLMANKVGDVWRFTFQAENGQWSIYSATSGSKGDEARVNWLDEFYSNSFRPFLEGLIRKSQ